jgi:hypothetical protein
VKWVEELIWADRRITIDSVATALGCTHDIAYSIIYDCFKCWKVCARWVPGELKDREKWTECLSLQHLLWYADEGEDMLNRIVAEDESWVHHNSYQPRGFSAMESSKFTFNQILEGYAISWEGHAYHVLGFSGSSVCPFSEAWWK